MPIPKSPTINLTPQERDELEALARSLSQEHRLVQRAKIVLYASEGNNNCEIGRLLQLERKTVRKWRQRYVKRRQAEPEEAVSKLLADADRCGPPPTFDAFFWVDVLVIATSDPKESGRPITEWTHEELAMEVVKQNLAESIHPTTIGRFLSTGNIKPHQVEGWMNRKKDPEFDERANDVKDCLVQATSDDRPQDSEDEVTVSFDEKTGMQARERIAPDQMCKPGQPKRIEFEYKRHGTLVLFAMMVVNTGMILSCTQPNRPNEVTALVLEMFFKQLFEVGYKKIHIILDQLNTHWSVALVEVVAKLCQMPLPSEKEIEKGIQRRTWLSSKEKAIVFHYTPKHASWLNPIEIWFAVLVRKVLRHGSFASKEELAKEVERFVDYYNEKLAYPYNFKPWRKAA